MRATPPEDRHDVFSHNPCRHLPGACHAEAVAWAVGQPADEAVMARVWRESGAGLIRPIAPGQAVTRDFRADRVNVHIDRDNRITAVSCG